MNAPALSAAVRRRRLVVRVALLLVYLGLVALFFVTGKAHTVLLDNKDTESLEGIDGVLVRVNRDEELELYGGDRDKAVIRGQGFRVRVEVIDDGTVVEKRLSVPLNENMVLLSIPALVAGAEPVLVPFVPLEVTVSTDDEEAITSEDVSPQMAPPAAEEAPAASGAQAPPGSP